MNALIIFLRGVNVGGHKTFRPSLLAKEMADYDVTSIGAVPEYSGTPNQIILTDNLGAISRRHCQVHLKNRKLYLVDCNSSNGTFLNGQRIPPQRYVPIKKGARIELAHAARLEVGFERKKS